MMVCFYTEMVFKQIKVNTTERMIKMSGGTVWKLMEMCTTPHMVI